MTTENATEATGAAGRNAVRPDAIDISDFVHGATGARIRRLTMPDGEHWFPAVDVCKHLGYTNPQKTLLDHVPETHRDCLETVTGGYGLSIPAGREWRRDLNLIDLRGLLHLVNGCTKPSCQPFKEWVVDIVVTVQREGSYSLAGSRTVSPEPEPEAVPPTPTVVHPLPGRVAEAIARLEERNIRLDEQFAAAQRETLRAQQATARALERIADRLDTLFATGDVSAPPLNHPHAAAVPPQPAPQPRPRPVRPTAEAVLDDWRSRMSVTEDVWAVAVSIAPVLAAEGELAQPLESIADRTGLTVHRVDECLRFMRKHACLHPHGVTHDGSPIYLLNRR
ncbi:Bro-N domain-containing protein [Streptomyces sp. NPDC002476]|uniref:BRO-N domain-containing protein n=1 Tax=Streptomyces sp. NPDC002476 TaxID=3364648 RepID=UPI0036AD7538